jgi:hypothetical protein
MRIYYLAGVILSVTAILSACGESTPTECTISTARELKQGVSKIAKFAPGTDCEAMRKLAEEGKPLPTIADATTTASTAKPVETPAKAAFNTPFVSGQKAQDLIAPTDKQARVQELEKKINADSKQARDPFTSTIINPVPKLETILAPPKQTAPPRSAVVVTSNQKIVPNRKIIAPPPPPPDTKAAEGTAVTGTIEIAGTIYAILTATNEPTSRYVRAGQLISNGKVLVKRIDTNSEPPIVVLQQNGVEVLRAVGAPVVALTAPNQTTATQTTPTQTTPAPVNIPPFLLAPNP